MRSLMLCALVPLSACVTAASVECREHGGPAWYRAQSSHFTVSGNLSPERLVSQAENLEHLLGGITWAMDYQGDTGGIDAIVLDKGHLARFEYDVGGVAQGSLFVAEANSYRDITGLIPRTATHELAHVVAGRAFPSIPRWLNEGLATYLETAKMTDATHLKIGAGIWGYQATLLGGLTATLDELWAWGSGEEPPEEVRGRLYSTAWAYVHYLSNHHRESFVRWLKYLREGKDARQTFEQIFPRFAQEQGPAAIEHMNGGAFVSATLTLTGGATAKAVEMSPAAVHLARRRLWSLAFRMTDERREAERAKELELARALPFDDSADTMKELLDLGLITDEQFLARANGRREVLREGALWVERGTPAGARLVEAALAAAPKDPVLGAFHALQLTATDEQEAERALASLEPLTDGEARVSASTVALAMLRCDKASGYLEGLQHAGVRGRRGLMRTLCSIKPLGECADPGKALESQRPALRAAQSLLGAPVGHTLKVKFDGAISVVVEPPNPVLAGTAKRVLDAAGLSACAPGEHTVDLRH